MNSGTVAAHGPDPGSAARDASAGAGKGAVVSAENKPGDALAEDEVQAIQRRRRKIVFAVFVIIIAVFVFAFATFAGKDYVIEKMTFGGIEREYIYYGPSKGNGKQALVAVLHGYGGWAPDIMDSSRMNDVADDKGFAVVYPYGTLDNKGVRFWNVGYPFNNGETVDDAAFIAALMLHASALHSLHTENLFVSGFSNGGDLIYMMACRYPHVIKASVSVSGMMLETIRTSDACMQPTALQASRAMPLLEVHGTSDSVTHWNGDLANAGGWGAYPSQVAMISYWATKHQCTATALSQKGQTTVHKHTGCGAAQGDAEVWLYEVEKGGHDWEVSGSDFRTSQDAWAFLEKYTATSVLNQ